MKFRKAVFSVVYAKNKDKIEYLLLKRKKHWVGWEFTKGKIEPFELKRMAAKRETEEETGLKVLRLKKFNVKGKYLYHKELADRPGVAGQTYHLFAAEVQKGRVKLDPKEHNGHKWVSFKQALKMLKWPNQKKCLKIVNSWLKHEIQRSNT